MELSGRRQIILAAVVDQFIKTGEPVGSKSLQEKLPISISSATIRNEMAELAELGYLEQPHTSAGRVPTQKGYRYYVDELMGEGTPDEEFCREIEILEEKHVREPDKLLEHAGEILAEYTNCTAISTTPAGERTYISRVEIVPISQRTVMLALLTSTGILKSKLCKAGGEITASTCEVFYNIVKSSIIGRRLDEMDIAEMQTLAASVFDEGLSIISLLAGVTDLAKSASQSEILLEGSSNIFSHRELEEHAYELLEFLNKSETVGRMLEMNPQDKNGISVKIGKENQVRSLEKSSFIFTNYNINGLDSGSIGLIGPTRIDYASLIPSVRYLSDLISKLLSQSFDD